MPEKRIYLSPPHISGNELEYVKDAFQSNWIAPLGPHVDGFERELSGYLNINDAAVLSSGTAAIHLALIMLNVRNDDFVAVSSFTFAGSINPVLYQGAVPLMVDSEPETWNMSPERLEDSIKFAISKNKKPKAIILVHLYGMPAKIEELLEIAHRYEIPVIEDAAEALGSSYKGRKLSGYGEMGILSFNGNKIITTSGGGALVSNNTDYISEARFLSQQARDNAVHYQHSKVGYNYRMSNILAAIGRGQLEDLDKKVENTRRNFDYYKQQLADIDGIQFCEERNGAFSNRWLTTILIDPVKTGGITRDDIMKMLDENNIESRPLWKPMHLQPAYKNYPFFADGTSEKLFDYGLCLPSGSDLTDAERERIAGLICKRFQK